MIQSGNRLEKFAYEKSLPIRRHNPRPRGRLDPLENEQRKRHRAIQARRADNIHRSAKSFRRIVWSNLRTGGCPSLLTLTLFQELSLSASSRIFTAFVATLRRRTGKDFRYIVVPEFQERGAVHFHALIWGLSDYACKGHWEKKYYAKGKFRKVFYCDLPPEAGCECSTRNFARVWLRGFCDFIETDGSPKLAGYLAKYMSKAMHDVRLGGQKAYYASRNILRPMYFSFDSKSATAGWVEEVIHTPELKKQREFGTPWLGRCIYQLFED